MLPRAPEVAARHPFPVLASVAPVVASVVIWAVTSSPFALVFALLGPVIAVASIGDSRIQARRQARREAERVMAETLLAADEIDAAHDREREELLRSAPGALAASTGIRDVGRWRASLSDPVPLALGRASVTSSLMVEGDSTAAPELARKAAVLPDAPLLVDARLGVGVSGAQALRRSVLRSLILQLAGALSPSSATIVLRGIDEPWFDELPHRVVRERGRSVVVEFQQGGLPAVVLAESEVPDSLPHDCRLEFVLDGASGRAVLADGSSVDGCRPEFVSLEQARGCASVLARAGSELTDSTIAVPDRASFAQLPDQPPPHPQSLATHFAVSDTGPLALDLVRHGPHAIVGGTTGSGKSELLVSWLLAMTAERSPAELSLLLVDFKGGASFAPIAGLPHVVGVVTDLDERGAARALHSLRAEVRRRERVLADHDVREISALADPETLPRLVIAIDEFAALQDGFDDLHRLVGDLASRGRSLGIHLVLCTQRPAGVIRDAVFANVRLRLSLAVNNAADSVAVIGTDAAARLTAEPPGRALIAVEGAEPRVAQVALVDRDDVRRVAARWLDARRARRPWCDDLPRALPIAAVQDAGGPFAFGLVDRPDEQSQAPARWDPVRDGNLVVIGGMGSGRTTAIAALCAARAATLVPADPVGAWDAVSAAVDSVRAGDAAGILAIDDVDVLVARLGDDHGGAFVDLLVELARTGRGAGLHLVVSLRRAGAQLHPLLAGCESRLLLRMPDRHEHLLAGGDPALYAADAPPGRGEWQARSIQIALERNPVAPCPIADGALLEPSRHPLVAVITRRERELSARLSFEYSVSGMPSSGHLEVRTGGPTAVVAGPDSWQSAWSALAALRGTAALVFDRCSIAEFRAISGMRVLPPPLGSGTDTAWLLEPDGSIGRVRLPSPAPRPTDEGREYEP